MAKRRFDQLTGGTRDVNMQYTSIDLTESAANTFTQGTITLPVLRGNVGRGKYQVIELLKVVFAISGGAGATGDGRNVQLSTTSKTTMVTTTQADPDIVCFWNDGIIITTSGLYVATNPIEFNFTDGAGHGIIIATDQMFFAVQGVSQTGALTSSCRLFYRFKNISVDEFVGLAIQQNG